MKTLPPFLYLSPSNLPTSSGELANRPCFVYQSCSLSFAKILILNVPGTKSSSNVNVDPFVNGMDLLYLLIRYTDEQIRAGKIPVYQTEELEKVLTKYLELRESFENTEWFAGDSVPLFYSYDLGTLDSNSMQAYLPLTFEKDVQPLYTPLENDFSFYVLNPHGKHIQEAVE